MPRPEPFTLITTQAPPMFNKQLATRFFVKRLVKRRNTLRKLVLITAMLAAPLAAASGPLSSMSVPGGIDAAGRKVLTFIAKDPPGQRCNNNLQVAAEVANTYRVPIQLLPSSLVPNLPAPSVFFGGQMIVADGGDYNGQASYQLVIDVLEMDGVAKQAKTGLLFNERVRKEYDDLRSIIKSGGK